MDNLYQNALKTHYSAPIGLNRSINSTHSAEGYNASCGDEITVSLQINENTINNIAFESDSCAICTASASILCEISMQKDLSSLRSLYQQLQHLLHRTENTELFHHKLKILQPIRQYPSRVNCALLPWQTLFQAFESPFPTQGNVTSDA